MFNTNFTTIAEARKVNGDMTEAQVVLHLKQHFANQNYRKAYNKQKAEITKVLANDPVVVKRREELKKKLA